MSYSREEVEARAMRYANSRKLTLVDQLGFGVHGIVWSTDRTSAVKVHAPDTIHYGRERDIYLRLQEHSVSIAAGFHVPELVDFDDELRAIEMAIVQPPFVLDFAGAYLDAPPDFSEEVWAEWRAAKEEQFGRNWPKARAVLAALKRFAVYMGDVSPSNICCQEEAPET
jgi:hypothetical protein